MPFTLDKGTVTANLENTATNTLVVRKGRDPGEGRGELEERALLDRAERLDHGRHLRRDRGQRHCPPRCDHRPHQPDPDRGQAGGLRCDDLVYRPRSDCGNPDRLGAREHGRRSTARRSRSVRCRPRRRSPAPVRSLECWESSSRWSHAGAGEAEP